jgi:hypothetical protein
MTHTHFHDDLRRVVHDRAYSYERNGETYQASPLNYANVGATSLFTTASDLARWLDNFRDPKVGGRAAVERLQEQAVLAGGKKIDYGLGVAIDHYRGLRTISHGGGDAGYRSYVLWFPEQELGIAVVSGLASFDSGGTANKVADALLGDKMTPQAPKTPGKPVSQNPRHYITLAPKTLEQYVGHYKMDAGLEADIRQKDGKLIGEVPGRGTEELHPVATNRFFIEALNGEVEFAVDSNGPVRLKFQQEGGVITGERIALVPWEPSNLEQYPGVYWSDELETQYTIILRDGKLRAEHIRHGEIPMVPAGRDRFAAASWFMPEAQFLRDASNRVSGLTLGGGRVTAIRFTRKTSGL